MASVKFKVDRVESRWEKLFSNSSQKLSEISLNLNNPSNVSAPALPALPTTDVPLTQNDILNLMSKKSKSEYLTPSEE